MVNGMLAGGEVFTSEMVNVVRDGLLRGDDFFQGNIQHPRIHIWKHSAMWAINDDAFWAEESAKPNCRCSEEIM